MLGASRLRAHQVFLKPVLARACHVLLRACPLKRARRDRALAKLGYRVLRLEAGLVLRQPALVIDRIQAALAGH